jgi:DNA-binding MarR family transcriptional regulator
LADRLIDKSLIVRKPDRDDGRTQTLALTQQGTSLVPALAALADQNDAEFFGRLSGVERKTLERILKRLAEQGQMTAMPVE